MMSEKLNDVRTEIMKKLKFEQMYYFFIINIFRKRRQLAEFVRKKKEEILNERKDQDDSLE